ncbi:MAG TPA: HesA/MoeB/ThiF family protein [Bacillota bacterium]|nr:HesA/MoeB/ThiF family protein [Bacillota bacterium]
MIPERYLKNLPLMTPEENKELTRRQVCVVGCGGLGGYIIEMLGRLGVGNITAVDGDAFCESNLNRQLLSTTSNIGKPKALAAVERMTHVNPLIKITAVTDYLTEKNATQILSGHDVIVDALDNITTRLLLQNMASDLNIPLVHGSIDGWYGQVTTIFPGDRTLDYIYPNFDGQNPPTKLGNPSFTPALVASIEVSEVLKILIGRGSLLRKKLLIIDTLEQEYEIIDI